MKKSTIITGVAALIVGVVIGAASDGSDSTTSADAPTVTKTVTKEVEGKTETVERTPQACIDALRDADQALSYAGDGFMLMSEAFGYAADMNISGMEAVNIELSDLTPKIESSMATYTASSAECRGA